MMRVTNIIGRLDIFLYIHYHISLYHIIVTLLPHIAFYDRKKHEELHPNNQRYHISVHFANVL